MSIIYAPSRISGRPAPGEPQNLVGARISLHKYTNTLVSTTPDLKFRVDSAFAIRIVWATRNHEIRPKLVIWVGDPTRYPSRTESNRYPTLFCSFGPGHPNLSQDLSHRASYVLLKKHVSESIFFFKSHVAKLTFFTRLLSIWQKFVCWNRSMCRSAQETTKYLIQYNLRDWTENFACAPRK